MKPLNLKEVQLISLDILTTIHNFCVENSIKYSLMYGTLIGAIRHKGFIPWDDDIDIIMPRPDYERFCKTFHAKGLTVLSETDTRSYIGFCRVCDTEQTQCVTSVPFAKGYSWGVWVDIFAADGVTDDKVAFDSEVLSLTKIWEKQIILRRALPPLKSIYSDSLKNDKVENKFKNILIFAIMKGSLLVPTALRAIKKQLRKQAIKIPFGSTRHWSQLACFDDTIHDYQLNEDFEAVTLMPFENKFFYVMNGYDRVLRNVYGDYMVPPPEDQRFKTSDVFYWKTVHKS